ncbi:MAG: tetratricopeptide repeat protein [Fidelibacterota bacterium]|nr:MAG: tetratricopeptide repeat protein [Candidatus Neomarinimicrobiota bacterium]
MNTGRGFGRRAKMMPDPPSRLAAFIAELKRRRVFRVAIVYAGVAFIVFQIIDAIFEPLHIPDWVGTTIIVLLLIGFPIAVALAWAFDITEQGLVRTKPKREPTAAKVPHHPLVGNKALAAIAVLAIAFGIWSWLREPSPGGVAISSIAVLPLDNQMGDPAEDYFVEGMHDAIITNLNRLSVLKVISRTSAMRYKDTDKLMPEIARELNVDALVEGSVLKAGDRVRITAQLIHGASDEHLWSNDYEGDLTDILSLQKTIAGAIAGEIGLALKPEEEADLASAPQVNPEAYNLYLKGWHFRKLESEESMPKAVEYLEQAVALNPTFARAWAALGHSYLQMQWLGGWSVDYAYNRMKQALDKALELDSNQAEAHAGLGIYQYLRKYDIPGAEASFRRALELDPNNVYARFEYGEFLRRTGRPEEGLEEYRRAQELDPLNPLPLTGIGEVYRDTRQYDKALEYWQAVLELAPNHMAAPYFLALTKHEIAMQQGRYAEAADEAGKAYAEATNGADSTFYFWLWQRAEWALGNREKVYAVRDSLRSTGELQQREQEHPFWSARLYAIMGERDKVLSLLEKAYEDTTKESYYPTGLVYGQGFDFLRAEPRFKALIQKMGLTEVFDEHGQRIR